MLLKTLRLLLRRLRRFFAPAPAAGATAQKLAVSAPLPSAPLPVPTVPIPPRSIQPAPAPAGGPALRAFLGPLGQAFTNLLSPDEEGAPAVRPSLRGHWHKSIPLLALTCADVQEAAPNLFGHGGATPAQLRAQEEAVRQLEQQRILIRVFARKVDCLLAARKRKLHDDTMALVTHIKALSRTPLLDEQDRLNVRQVQQPIEKVLSDRNDKTQDLRRHRAHLRAQNQAAVQAAQGELAVKTLENEILRGTRLTKADLAKARAQTSQQKEKAPKHLR